MKDSDTLPNSFLLLCAFLLLAGCDQTFEPLQENEEYYFSIYGYLDAAADTQWVRVGPARRGLNDLPDPTGIDVALENLQTGETVAMEDSLFTPDGYLNYWTTYDIQNEETYQLTVKRDGNSSRVTVTTPEEWPTPFILDEKTFPPYGYYIFIDETVQYIADLQAVWYVTLHSGTESERKIYRFNLRNRIEYTALYGGAHLGYATKEDQRNYIEKNSGTDDITVEYRQIFVAAAGPDWDENISSINDLEYFLDGTASNVENGLGYVVGIDSKWIPLKSCYNSERSDIRPCPEEEPFWW